MKPPAPSNSSPDAAAAGLIQPHARIDLRGKKCPMTFVYTKLELEKLRPGDILEVRLNYPPSFTNVARSVALQELGKIVQDSSPAPGEKSLWIRKA
jgi:tRNA 2-thiouridine synthesizing protein A